MPTISPTLPNDGDDINTSDVNDPLNAIIGLVNGNLDGSNLDETANFQMNGLTVNTIDATTGTFDSLTIAGTASAEGWSALGATPDTVTANGNRSYSMVFNSNDLTDTLSPGMRLKATRTVTAPTQCADLESSSSQYFNKTSPSGMTFTDDFVVSAWVKLENYTASNMTIASRYNGTSGWSLHLAANSRQVLLQGFNAGANNYSYVLSTQSIPLGKWVHIAAQLDMSAFTATTTTSYIMIDGVNVPASVSRAGTNPTALIQAGNLEIGTSNGGTVPFDGEIAQVAIYSAKVTQANIRATMSQALTGSETSIISAYSLSNSLNDLAATANNLTAQNSAVATATDTPFAGGSVGTTEYGIVTAATFSTNTTLTVQVPEGYAIPTTGGVSAVSYSINKIPYGFPAQADKWSLLMLNASLTAVTSGNTWAQIAGGQLLVPVGSWVLRLTDMHRINIGGVNDANTYSSLSTSTSSASDDRFIHYVTIPFVASIDGFQEDKATSQVLVTTTSPTTYYHIAKENGAIAQEIDGSVSPTVIEAINAYL